jgi:hypothetical protein
MIGSDTARLDRLPFTKKVAVMMSFGGDDHGDKSEEAREIARRRATLDFMRIRYLVEKKVAVKTRGIGEDVFHVVKAYNLNVGDVAPKVITAIAEADIVVGLLTERNVNVVFELAVRNLLKDEMLLLVKGDPDELVPIYLQGWARIRYDQMDAKDVIDEIETLARASQPRIDLYSPIPPTLIEAMERQEDRLGVELERALQDIELANFQRRPDHILDLAKYLDPGRMLAAWTTYYPYSVVRIRWRKRGARTGYTAEDIDGDAVVYSANDEFMSLYNRAGRLPAPDGPDALTAADLLMGLSRDEIVDNLDEFVQDNDRVARRIIFGDGFAWSRVPLRLNQNHPIAQYRKTSYLPNMVGKRIIGAPERPHAAYYLIMYTPVEQ